MEYIEYFKAFVPLLGVALGWYLSQKTQMRTVAMQHRIEFRKRREENARKIIFYCLKIKRFYSRTEFNARKVRTNFEEYKKEENDIIDGFLKIQAIISFNEAFDELILKQEDCLQEALSFIQNYSTIWHEQKNNNSDTKETETKIDKYSQDIIRSTNEIVDIVKCALRTSN